MRRPLTVILAVVLAAALFVLLGYERTRAANEWYVLPQSKITQRYIKRIKVEGDIIYVGTASGLNVYDTQNDKITSVQGLPAGGYVQAIAFDAKNIWVGTPEGLAQVDKLTGQTRRVYTKTNSELSQNDITDVVVDGSQVWIGTRGFGINLLDTATGKFKNYIIQLQGQRINAIALDGQNVWVATELGLNVYDKSLDLWSSYLPANGLAYDKVSCLAVDGEYVWAGTSGGGLSRFEKLGSSFFNYTSASGLVSDSVQCLTLDGNYLWIGTFSGVNRFDKIKNEWKVFRTTDGLPEDSIADIAISGNFAWFGTDGGGLARFDKVIPEAYLSPLTHYIGASSVEVVGTSYSFQDIVSCTIEHRSEIINQYMKTGVSMVRDLRVLNAKLADWNVKDIPDGTYYLRLTVQDKAGNANSSQLAFIVDNIKPIVTVDLASEAVNIANISISGHYQEFNLVRLYLKKGNDILAADIDRNRKTWSCDVTLTPGLNQFRVVAEDIAGQATETTVSLVYDTDRPEFNLSADEASGSASYALKGEIHDYALSKIVLNPREIQVPFTAVENKPYSYSFSADVQLNDGENKFTLDAYDKVGNKTSFPLVRRFNGSAGVSFDKTITRIAAKNFVARGTWVGANVKAIWVSNSLTGVKVPAVTTTAGGRAFNASVGLKDGENILTATVLFTDNTTGFDILPVICELEASKLSVDLRNPFSAERKFLITGRFQESSLKDIMLQPDNQRAAVDTKSNTFQVPTTLKSERNPYSIVLSDKSGRKVQKDFTIVFDETPPVVRLDDIPGIVPFSPVTIKGSFEEKYLSRIVASPAGASASIDTNSKTFEIRLPLQAGENNFVLQAFDKANNESDQKLTVKFVPQAVTSLPEEGVPSSDTNILKRLKFLQDEIARLRNNQQVIVPGAGGPSAPSRVAMPAGNAVFFVPFNSAGGDSLYTVANDYLGSPAYVSLISALNDNVDYSIITRRRSILMPTRGLVRYLNNQSAFDVQSQLLNAMAVAYNRLGGGRPVEDYYRTVGELLYSNDIVTGAPSAGRPIEVHGSLVVITRGPADSQSLSGLKKTRNYKSVIVGSIEGRTMRFTIL